MPGPMCNADCHAHVMDLVRYPAMPGVGYTPLPHEQGDAGKFRDVLAAHGLSRGLLVQPSCYGFDNSAMLDALARGAGRFAGIAVVPVDMSSAQMWALQRQGIVGVRLNLGNFDPGFLARADADDFLKRIRDIGWFVQVYALGQAWDVIAERLAASRARILIDHLGHPQVEGGIGQPGFRAVLALGREADAVVKLSGAFRISRERTGFQDVDPFAQAAVEHFGIDRCIWGSDWPFINTDKTVNYAEQLALLRRWLPDETQRRTVLAGNPARLFGFRDGPAEDQGLSRMGGRP